MSGIYIHIPFCKQACYYCDFHFSTSLKRKEEMLTAIKRELIMRKDEIKDVVDTVYFGGGTPSMLNTTEILGLLETIKAHFKLSEAPEITLEANPDDLVDRKIKELADSPVNRLSIGIQSFFDKDLQFMNRAHNAIEAKKSLELAARYFDNISVDLIYGIPHLSDKRWKINLETTFDLGVTHISSYALTVEPKTALDHFIKKGTYPPLSETLAKNHFEILREATEKEGYIQYEISNFAKDGYFSKHNSSYWKGASYLGIGPSAHSYNGFERSWNVSNNAKYRSLILDGKHASEKERLSHEDKVNELIMTGLRTIWGVSLEAIEEIYGPESSAMILKQAQKHLDLKTLRREKHHLYITKKGHFLADGIAADLFLLKH